jgi:hypothetical protein
MMGKQQQAYSPEAVRLSIHQKVCQAYKRPSLSTFRYRKGWGYEWDRHEK